MIVIVEINNVIYRMEDLHKIPKVGKKLHGIPYEIHIIGVNWISLDLNTSKSPKLLKKCPYPNILKKNWKYNLRVIIK